MTSIKEIKAKKVHYTELDAESQEFLYQMFKRYVVRRQITETNKQMTALFARRYGNNPREFSRCFNDFNSAFVGGSYPLIHYLNYDESQTDYLKNMTEDQFNYYLKKYGDSFERKIALMCFSLRPSERIANRLEFPAMVAYADMQTLVLDMARKNPKTRLCDIFEAAAKTVHKEFYDKNGYVIQASPIAETRTDYKAEGKKAAKLWQQMFDFYMKGLKDFKVLEAGAFVLENFVFTQDEIERYKRVLDVSMSSAHTTLVADRAAAQERMEENPDSYVPSDYDEVFSRDYAEDVYSRVMEGAIVSPFIRYLEDPIFEQKEPKKKGE